MAEVTACPKDFGLERLQPILVAGDAFQAILSTECIPEQSKKEPIGSLYHLGFSELLKWVLLEISMKSMSSWTAIEPQGALVLFWMNL